MSGDPRTVSLRQRYALAGAPYGQSETGFDRWCDELEDSFFDPASRDPRRMAPSRDRDAPSPNAAMRPQ